VSGGTARQRRAARRLPAGERRRLRGCFVNSTGDYWATCEEGNDDVRRRPAARLNCGDGDARTRRGALAASDKGAVGADSL
jgi:hypothetical protein